MERNELLTMIDQMNKVLRLLEVVDTAAGNLAVFPRGDCLCTVIAEIVPLLTDVNQQIRKMCSSV